MNSTIIRRVIGLIVATIGAAWVAFSGYKMSSPLWRYVGTNPQRSFWIASGHLTYSVRTDGHYFVVTVGTLFWASILVALVFVVIGLSSALRKRNVKPA